MNTEPEKTAIMTDVPVDFRIDVESFLRRLNRDTYVYIEGDRELVIHANKAKGEDYRIIEVNRLRKWAPPYEQEELSEKKRMDILHKVVAFFDRNHIRYKIS